MTNRLVSLDTTHLQQRLQNWQTTANTPNADFVTLCDEIFTTVQNVLTRDDQRLALIAEHTQRIAEKDNTIADLSARLTQAEVLNDPATTERLTTMEDENQALCDEDAIRETVLADLRTQLHNAQEVTLAMARGNVAAATQVMKLPDIEKFDGDKSKLQQWIIRLRQKVANFALADQLSYTLNPLEGNAFVQVTPYIDTTTNRQTFTTLNELIEVFETVFGNQNRRAEAELQLQILIQ